MKNYLIAALIPCLINLLCGCYSTKYLTAREIQNYQGDDPVTIKDMQGRTFLLKKFDDKNSAADFIKTYSDCLTCQEWQYEGDSITAVCSGNEDLNWDNWPDVKILTKSYSLKSSDIKEIYAKTDNPSSTLLLTMGGILFIFLVLSINGDSGIEWM